MKPNRRIGEPDGQTAAELDAMLLRMQAASDRFYREAQAIGFHAWIEFTGLLNEFIKVCKVARDNGQDFTMASIHTGDALPLKPYHAAYLAEKIACIYGAALTDPALWEVFRTTLLGEGTEAT